MTRRIIIHHTAGNYKPNLIDLKCYHYLIDDVGIVHKGYFTVEDNDNCKDNKYAAHTYLGNTGSIGVAACCNYGFTLATKHSKNPFTLKQFEAICRLCARLCVEYSVKISDIYTHYGYDKLKNIKQGKVDITYLSWKPELNPMQVQNYFRQRIKELM